MGLAGFLASYPPVMLAGIGLIVSTVPASLTFDNDSRKGRFLFGIITAAIYLIVIVIFVLEALRHPDPELHQVSVFLGLASLVGMIACTWLGNVRSLRRSDDS